MDSGCSRKVWIFGRARPAGFDVFVRDYGGGIGGWDDAWGIFSGGMEREIRYQLSGIGSRPCDAWGASRVTWRA